MPDNDVQIPISAPVHRSLSRPVLLAGCDRAAFIFLSVLSVFVAGPLGFINMRPVVGIFGVVFFFLGRWYLTELSQDDPLWREIAMKSVSSKTFIRRYPATTKRNRMNTHIGKEPCETCRIARYPFRIYSPIKRSSRTT